MDTITLIKNSSNIIPIGTIYRCVAGSIKNGTNIIAATTNQINEAAKSVAVIVPGVAISLSIHYPGTFSHSNTLKGGPGEP